MRVATTGTHEAYLVPIDACYELVGQLRRLWRGFDGGTEASDALDAFFADLPERVADDASLAIEVLGGRPEPYAAVPDPAAPPARRASRAASPSTPIVLRAQIRIEPQRRRYSAEEEARLLELFGEAPQWGESLRPVPVDPRHRRCSPGSPAAPRSTCPVPCTYDFEVAAAKYLHALGDGEIPLVLLFSGTVFAHRDGVRRRCSRCRGTSRPSTACPVAVWRDADGPLLPEQRLDPPPPRDDRRPHPLQGRPRPRRRGRTRSSACSRRPGR